MVEGENNQYSTEEVRAQVELLLPFFNTMLEMQAQAAALTASARAGLEAGLNDLQREGKAPDPKTLSVNIEALGSVKTHTDTAARLHDIFQQLSKQYPHAVGVLYARFNPTNKPQGH